MDDDGVSEAEECLTGCVGEPTERDVWAAAGLLIKQFGRDATVFAAMKADEWLAAGDVAQYRLSKRILLATEQLLAEVPPPGVRLS
jgi:hypothetical protein